MIIEQPERQVAQRPPDEAPPVVTETAPRAVRARHRLPRRVAALTALALLLVVNLTLAANRRQLDIESDGFGILARVDRCETLGRNPDVLFLGSSRAVHGAAPPVVDDTVRQQAGIDALSCNAAMFGSTFAEDYYILKRMLDDGVRPRLIVENVWEYNLNAGALANPDGLPAAWEQIRALAGVTDLPALPEAMPRDAGPVTLVDVAARKLVPLYGDRSALVRRVCGSATIGPCEAAQRNVEALQGVPSNRGADTRGWIPATGATIADLGVAERIEATTSRYSYLRGYVQDFRTGTRQLDYLARMLDLARSHGSQVALVVSPLHPYFYSYLDAPGDWQRMMGVWQTFAQAHAVPFYDRSQAPDYTDADFSDPHHLSKTGAEKFSRWMAQQIVVPVLGATG